MKAALWRSMSGQKKEVVRILGGGGDDSSSIKCETVQDPWRGSEEVKKSRVET